jgi:hypothetical protein
LDDLGRPETDLIQVRNIDGLDPVKAAINTSPYGSVDGVAFNGANVATGRNIVLTLHPNPDWDDWAFESLRRLLYEYFMPKQPTRLVFHSDDIPPVEISGYVESCEVNPFSKDVELLVSIICPDPYFTAVTATVVTGTTDRDNTTPEEITYEGNIETGINVEVSRISDPAPTSIAIQVRDPGLAQFRVTATVSASMYFLMNSVDGAKYVQNVGIGSGLITNLLGKVAGGSSWPTLQPGVNDFSVITDAGAQDWQLTYFARYGGL